MFETIDLCTYANTTCSYRCHGFADHSLFFQTLPNGSIFWDILVSYIFGHTRRNNFGTTLKTKKRAAYRLTQQLPFRMLFFLETRLLILCHSLLNSPFYKGSGAVCDDEGFNSPFRKGGITEIVIIEKARRRNVTRVNRVSKHESRGLETPRPIFPGTYKLGQTTRSANKSRVRAPRAPK